MKRAAQLSVAVLLLVIIAVSTLGMIDNSPFVSAAKSPDDNAFYVGVTYCGNSVSDAKLLIDKVKNYTNLFVLQSGSLQTSNESIDAIGDYTVNSGLNFIAYMGVSSFALANNWLSGYNGRWGTHFLGIYLDDEPGGKMLDGRFYLTFPNIYSSYPGAQQFLIKTEDGTISGFQLNQTNANYMRNGTVSISPVNITLSNNTNLIWGTATYYKNGTITAQKDNYSPEIIVDGTSIMPYYTYNELWNACPIQNPSQAAEIYANQPNRTITTVRSESASTLKMFTSDYALQWFDYQSGYDVVLTEFGWNQSTTQEIAQARGAANLYGKDWGAMITWKYMQTPYLASGDEIYQQMCQAYENGAKYIAIFNYSPDMQGAYGTLQDEHFQALQRFWTDEVNNPNVIRGQVKADTAFVLPNDFGSGLRKQQDIVWGLWQPTQQEQQVWLQLQNALATYGQKLDIVYYDSVHPASDAYSKLVYPSFTNWLLIALGVAAVAAVLAGLLVVRRIKRKSWLEN